ncbi:MAG: hypothetical protein RL217_1004 [Pseudomonadota bacterium]
MIRLARCLFFLPTVAVASTLEYGSSVENTSWQVSGSVFGCRFEQPLPGYGTALFFHEAGEPARFQLESLRNLLDLSQAQISILPPPWQPSAKAEPLGTAKLVKDNPNLSLDANRSNQFLHALLEGRWPAISHHTFYDPNKFVQLHLSAVKFQDYYPVYLRCVKQLLPVNSRQVENSKVYFDAGNDSTLDPNDKKVLDKIIFYIKHDPRVFSVYLDGHSDNAGRRFDNREISRARAEQVERYFIKQGINSDMISTRFHGDRYPIADNATAKGRALNRRVTVRLEMREDTSIPDDLIFRPDEKK